MDIVGFKLIVSPIYVYIVICNFLLVISLVYPIDIHSDLDFYRLPIVHNFTCLHMEILLFSNYISIILITTLLQDAVVIFYNETNF